MDSYHLILVPFQDKFSYIKRRTKSSDGIPSLLLHENSNILTESDYPKLRLYKTFSEVYLRGIVNNARHNHTTVIPATGPVDVTGEAVLRLIISFRPGKTKVLNGLRP